MSILLARKITELAVDHLKTKKEMSSITDYIRGVSELVPNDIENRLKLIEDRLLELETPKRRKPKIVIGK